MKEKPSQSLESQLKMARPKRSEVKRVPLTPEEKEFLGKIMEKAVAAEKAGKLKEALDFYIDYKNELSKIKEKKEKKAENIVWTKEKLEEWAADIGMHKTFIEDSFDLTKLPKLETKGTIRMNNQIINEFPANMVVHNELWLPFAKVKKWIGTGLVVKGNCMMGYTKIDCLPKNTHVEGILFLGHSEINNLPDDLFVGGNIRVIGCNKKVIEKARQLKSEGKILGKIIEFDD